MLRHRATSAASRCGWPRWPGYLSSCRSPCAQAFVDDNGAPYKNRSLVASYST
jgi:hypothetical protein